MNITEHAIRCAKKGVALSITPRPNGTVGVTLQRMCDGLGTSMVYYAAELAEMHIDGVNRDIDTNLQQLGF